MSHCGLVGYCWIYAGGYVFVCVPHLLLRLFGRPQPGWAAVVGGHHVRKIRKWQQTTSTYWCPYIMMSISLVRYYLFSFWLSFRFGRMFSCLNWVLLFRFLSSCTRMRVASHMTFEKWLRLPTLRHCNVSILLIRFIYVTSVLMELLYEWYNCCYFKNRDPYSVLEG